MRGIKTKDRGHAEEGAMTRNLAMRITHAGIVIFILVAMIPGDTGAVTATPPELQHAQAWARANFQSSGPRRQIPPFSFIYDGKPSADLLKRWQFASGPRAREGSKLRQQFTYLDPSTGLEVICDATTYDD